jgi:exodeoxyribonuclease III
MLLFSWNVNGYNDVVHTWLTSYIKKVHPDIIFLSETKKSKDDLLHYFTLFTDYNVIINSHTPPKWHGVAMLILKEHSFQQLPIEMNIASRKDTNSASATTGRVIGIYLPPKEIKQRDVFQEAPKKKNGELYIIGSYTPNSGRADPAKLEYRTKVWDPCFASLLESLKTKHTIWLGDINVALNDIDVSNSKGMKTYAGFTVEERDNLKTFLSGGEWIDIWREQHPNERGYTWCGTPHRKNYGMRLDNMIISKSLLPLAESSSIIVDSPPTIDHRPITSIICYH